MCQSVRTGLRTIREPNSTLSLGLRTPAKAYSLKNTYVYTITILASPFGCISQSIPLRALHLLRIAERSVHRFSRVARPSPISALPVPERTACDWCCHPKHDVQRKMAGKGGIARAYLVLYNTAQSLGYAACLAQIILALKESKGDFSAVYSKAGELTSECRCHGACKTRPATAPMPALRPFQPGLPCTGAHIIAAE